MLQRHLRAMLSLLTALLFGLPAFSQTFSLKNYSPYTDDFQLQVGDFNRDGAADLLGVANINNATQTQVFVYLNNGSGGFGAPSAIAGTVGAGAVAVGDFNGDGNLDFAFTTATSVGVALGNGKGGFGTPNLYSVNGAPQSIAAGDYNGDGKMDIAALSDITKTVTVLTNTGTSFTSYNFGVPLYFSGSHSGYPPDAVGTLVAGDFNGNHRIDLAYLDTCTSSDCAPAGLSRVYSLTNNNNNTFTANLLADQFSYFDQLYAADVDLDGKVDLIVSESSSSSGVDTNAVEYSNGNGSFTQVDTVTTTAYAGYPANLVVGDFNNDGIMDIAVLTEVSDSSYNYGGFDIYAGLGGRSGFNYVGHYADLSTATVRGGFAAAFFNKNGTKDVALDDTSGMSVFLNSTSTSKDPCPYLTGSGLNVCLPAKNGAGPSPVKVLASYKAAVQPAQRIEVWADGSKLFQEYNDLLNTTVTLANGTHTISVIGVDATGKYVTTNESFTVIAACPIPKTAGLAICSPGNNATVSSPVSVSAAALAPSGLTITALRLYSDNVALYTSNGATLYYSAALAKGTHHLVVVAYENNGGSITAGEYVTVQ